jgi:adenylyltransferase/sulfurtransferase
MLTPSELSRYSRQIRLGGIGAAGQERLSAARVLVAGLGGLGGPAALYLAAAGVGTLGIADFDRVEEHNLHRQILFGVADVGRPKVEAAGERLRAVNSLPRIVAHPEGVTRENATGLFQAYDLIVDGTDTFAARYLNNDAAVLAGRPLVHGSVYKFEGQVCVFDSGCGGPCYRCLYPEPPPGGSVPACGDAGVLGPLCGVVGSLQAVEAIKLICGLGDSLRGTVLVFDAMHGGFHSFGVARDPECKACGRGAGSGPPPAAAGSPAPAPGAPHPIEISVEESKRLLEADPKGTLLIDVREPYEVEICRIAGSEAIPLREIPARAASLPRDRLLLMLCHHGHRSMAATEHLRAHGHPLATNVEGGIDAWARRIDPTLRKY